MTQNEEAFLRLHLPVIFNRDYTAFDGAICVDGGSQDGTVAYLESMGVQVVHRRFDFDWSAQGNFLIRCCEDAGYTHLLRLDPDELMFERDIWWVRGFLEGDTSDLVAFSRYHFIGDRTKWNPAWSPDSQWRAWKLNMGIDYPGMKVHETPRHVARMKHLENIWIYHYGWTNSAAERDYRTATYAALQHNQPLPSREDYHNRPPLNIPSVPFTGKQPLDPAEIGARAPFETESA